MKNDEQESPAPEPPLDAWMDDIIRMVKRRNRAAMSRWAKEHPDEPFPFGREKKTDEEP